MHGWNTEKKNKRKRPCFSTVALGGGRKRPCFKSVTGAHAGMGNAAKVSVSVNALSLLSF